MTFSYTRTCARLCTVGRHEGDVTCHNEQQQVVVKLPKRGSKKINYVKETSQICKLREQVEGCKSWG
jgi:hypothetical protein